MSTSSTRTAAAVRSLADDVRSRSDEQLRTLVRRRPDLARPAPSDLTSLAARASTRASVQRALDGLDRGHLQVLEALVISGDPVDPATTARLLGTSVRSVDGFVRELWDRGLLWRGGEGQHVVRAVSEVLGPHPAGLGPSIAELPGSTPAWSASAKALDSVIGSAPADARNILDMLTWGPPVGTLSPGGPMASAGTWLLAHQLIGALSGDHVVLPREVALRLRGGKLHRETALTAPNLTVTAHEQPSVDDAAGGQASELLGLVDEIAADWGPRPPRVLRAGGLSVRDFKRLATNLDVDSTHAAFVVETAYAAGLLADDGSLEPVWAPTPGYDDWQQRPSANRWIRLSRDWLASGRAPHLVGTTPAGGGGPVNALSGEVVYPPMRQLRGDVLTELAALPEGEAPTLGSLADRIRWRRPMRRAEIIEAVTAAVLHEAEWLGITGRGALSTAGRLLFESDTGTVDPSAAEDAINTHLPSPVEHVLLQADLTAVAPGRLEGSLAQFMRLVADVESRGGATVYRFSPQSVRRGLDAGWSSAQVLSTLQDASRTPVPQPLEYLVGDVARRHGQTRVGSVQAYIRSDDTTVLATMLADRGLAALQLRRIAPTVVVSQAHTLVVLEMLRENGFAPVAETTEGGVQIPRVAQHRTPARRAPAAPKITSVVDDELTHTLVAALRAGEESAAFERARAQSQPGPRLPSTEPAVALALLREASADSLGVWIGYADADGRTTRILFYPKRIEGGRAYGSVEGSNVERTFSIHRITGAAVS
ncbi:MAG TPA: helicase-associated domain-containing protein [Dermatophilaceae bacterium]|nr:helicase-associated domain-containing protein [Dermatophilaceae bacterium]